MVIPSEANAIILAAGVGSRLRPLTDETPKCLVPVAGRPVLGWQLDALAAAGVRRITVVAGYRAEQVVSFCEPFRPRVQVVINEAYASTNNMYSLRLGAATLDGRPALLCNGDVVFDAAIVRGLVGATHADLIAAEAGRYIDESMKIEVRSGRVVAMSKTVPRARAWGVSIDVYRFCARTLCTILDVAAHLIEQEGQANLWTEVAIDRALPGLDVRPYDIESRPWMEIDSAEDLAHAERLFARPGSPA